MTSRPGSSGAVRQTVLGSLDLKPVAALFLLLAIAAAMVGRWHARRPLAAAPSAATTCALSAAAAPNAEPAAGRRRRFQREPRIAKIPSARSDARMISPTKLQPLRR